ncbi:MAG TPA: LysR family transcriptional regulator [Pseudonocardiaceae bacterium]|jgi:DNA-binding transcriptional LysR family regulator|nr:LysR family transcriptional regulator [Pseudonocardiaceae bacterium]
MLDNHRLRLLRLFALHGSISATAEAAGFSASAVSQQLAALEREAGAALLERSARSAVLTDAGRALAGHAATVLAAVEAAEADLAALGSEVAGRVTVGAVPTTALTLGRALAGVQRAHPRLEVVLRQVHAGEAVHGLHTRELDVAVVDEWPPHRPATVPGLSAVRLRRDPLVLAVPVGHSLAGEPGPVALTGAVLAGQTLLCAPTDQPSRAATDRLLAAGSVQPAARWEFEGLATIAALVAGGSGVAVLPRLAIAQLPPGSVVTRELSPARFRRISALVRSASRRAPTVARVLAAIRARER